MESSEKDKAKDLLEKSNQLEKEIKDFGFNKLELKHRQAFRTVYLADSDGLPGIKKRFHVEITDEGLKASELVMTNYGRYAKGKRTHRMGDAIRLNANGLLIIEFLNHINIEYGIGAYKKNVGVTSKALRLTPKVVNKAISDMVSIGLIKVINNDNMDYLLPSPHVMFEGSDSDMRKMNNNFINDRGELKVVSEEWYDELIEEFEYR